MVAEAAIRRRFRLIERHLDERLRRLVAAAEVAAAGAGGVSAVARATGVSRRAIRAGAYLRQGGPAISVDTKKKELVGNFKNAGREWRPRGQPRPVQVHDFVQPELGRAIPYGVYDLGANTGWVSVGIDHDTAAFAVASIRRWWQAMGRRAYPHARRLLITADAGGSNVAPVRVWKVELQKLADHLRRPISVCHFPPGTSKWNKIEHRLFSFISQNWRGQPWISHSVILNLIT